MKNRKKNKKIEKFINNRKSYELAIFISALFVLGSAAPEISLLLGFIFLIIGIVLFSTRKKHPTKKGEEASR